jgi:homoserine O-acetyltransferase/O-succinyltransferase
MSGYYSHEVHGEHQYFDLGNFPLSTGYTLPNAKLAYKTLGTLNAAKDNLVLFPHMYSGTSASMQGFVGADRPLDPSKYFVVFPGQFGGGFSSSPSNTPSPFEKSAFPAVATADDVVAQHRLVTEQFGVGTIHTVLGWSMGGQQTYEWIVRFPDLVQRAGIFAATARTPVHNQFFIDVYTALLRSDSAFDGGFYADSADVHVGLRRKAAAFALQGATPELFRNEVWRDLGFISAQDFRQGFVEAYFLPMDPNNLLCQANKWRNGDVGGHAGGDLAGALGRVRARTFVVPFEGDQFFPVPDCEADVQLIPGAELRVVKSPWGHFTMFCLNEQDIAAIDAVLAEILA